MGKPVALDASAEEREVLGLISMMTVSYTHLDVYKRQGLSEYIVHVDIEHGAQIGLGSWSQVSHVHKQGTQKENDDPARNSA